MKKTSRAGMIARAKELVSGNPEMMRLAGWFLIVDAVVGVENPFDGQDKRKGIFGVLSGLVGLIFFLCIFQFVFLGVMGTNHLDDPTPMTATVKYVDSSGSSDGSSTCTIHYQYEVDGKTYDGSTNASSSNFCGFHPNSELTGYYDKTGPSVSVLSVEKNLDGLFKYAFYGVFAIVGVGLVLSLARIIAELVVGRHLIRKAKELGASSGSFTEMVGQVREFAPQFFQNRKPSASPSTGMTSWSDE